MCLSPLSCLMLLYNVGTVLLPTIGKAFLHLLKRLARWFVSVKKKKIGTKNDWSIQTNHQFEGHSFIPQFNPYEQNLFDSLWTFFSSPSSMHKSTFVCAKRSGQISAFLCHVAWPFLINGLQFLMIGNLNFSIFSSFFKTLHTVSTAEVNVYWTDFKFLLELNNSVEESLSSLYAKMSKRVSKAYCSISFLWYTVHCKVAQCMQ